MATSRFLIVGKYAVGSNRGLNDVDLVDTRVRGGGIKEELVTDFKGSYPQIRWFHDIGHYDGTPFPGATAVLVDLPASLLEVNGGVFNKKQIDSIVKHHLSFGIYPVIRFYCTNTGLVKHEDVLDSTGAGTWDVPDGETCPDEDGTVLCMFETFTTTTTTTTTTTAGAEAACTGAVWYDELASLDTNIWTENDLGGDADFVGGNWVKTGVGDPELLSETGVYIEGDWDLCVGMDIDEVNGNDDSAFAGPYLIENQAMGTAIWTRFHPRTGSKVALNMINGGTNWHSQQFDVPGTFILRFVRNSTTWDHTVYMWNDALKRWEWDGDPAGLVYEGGIDANQAAFRLRWQDTDPVWIKGKYLWVSLNAGTLVTP